MFFLIHKYMSQFNMKTVDDFFFELYQGDPHA